MAHAWNSLCNIIVHTTSNLIILLYSLLPNSTSILHLTPLYSSQSFHFLMSHLPTPLCPHSTIPIHLLSVPPPPIHLLPYPPSFHPSPTCPSPISWAIFYLAPSPSSRIWTPPHPINLFVSYSVIITLIQTNYYSNFIQHLIISHIWTVHTLSPMTPPP